MCVELTAGLFTPTYLDTHLTTDTTMSYYMPSYANSSINDFSGHRQSSPYNHITNGNYVTPFTSSQLPYNHLSSSSLPPTQYPAQHPGAYGGHGGYYSMPPPSPMTSAPCIHQSYPHGHMPHEYHSSSHCCHHAAMPPVVLPSSNGVSYVNTSAMAPTMASNMPNAHYGYGAPVYTTSGVGYGYYGGNGMASIPVMNLSSRSSSSSDRHHRSRHHRHGHHSRHSGHSSSSRSSSRASSPGIMTSHGHKSGRSSRGLLTFLPSL